MKTRVAALSIIVDDPESVEKINDELHKVRSYVVGRMGIPYSRRGISIISLVIEPGFKNEHTLALLNALVDLKEVEENAQ